MSYFIDIKRCSCKHFKEFISIDYTLFFDKLRITFRLNFTNAMYKLN